MPLCAATARGDHTRSTAGQAGPVVRGSSYREVVSPSTCPNGSCCPAPEDINDLIRRLMDEPATPDRAERSQRLLAQWAAVTRVDVEPAA
jgi:hypothetical protein